MVQTKAKSSATSGSEGRNYTIRREGKDQSESSTYFVRRQVDGKTIDETRVLVPSASNPLFARVAKGA